MPDWLSHVLMLLAGVPLGGFFNFLLTRRKQTADEWQSIVTRQGERIAALEAKEEAQQRRIDAIMADHMTCLQNTARMEAKIAVLESAGRKT